jgi:hypothetical protein
MITFIKTVKTGLGLTFILIFFSLIKMRRKIIHFLPIKRKKLGKSLKEIKIKKPTPVKQESANNDVA